jgi:hypothetical protein
MEPLNFCRFKDEKCTKVVPFRGIRLCNKHYKRMKRKNETNFYPLPTAQERFWSKVKKTNTCWNWIGAKSNGYGRFREKNKSLAAHRFSLKLHGIKLIKGLHVDHLCRNPACVNPEHLEQVTCRINILRGVGIAAFNKRKTHCKHGHEFTNDNILIRDKKYRICKTCNRIYFRKYDLIRKAS